VTEINQLNELANQFFAERERKPFSQRHPELGKMVNCTVCGLRHRAAKTCLPVYGRVAGEVNDEGEVVISTRKQMAGAAAFKGRILKHRNKRSLQVLERATLIYRERLDDRYTTSPPYAGEDNEEALRIRSLRLEYEDELGKVSLSRALNEIRRERALDRKVRLKRTKASRKINRK
jgi:hypothetical protein